MKIRKIHLHMLFLAAVLSGLMLLGACSRQEEPLPSSEPAATATPAPTATPTPVPTEAPKPEGVANEPRSLSARRGYALLPHSAWLEIEKICWELNPLGRATIGSVTIYDLPGYDYTITKEEVFKRGTSGGFCCAGYVSWLFYNQLPLVGYGDAVNKLQKIGSGYKSVRFYCQQNKGPAREIRIEDAQLGDLILFGGQKTDHQHIAMYAGRDSAGRVMIWHSGQDGVTRMRADKVRTNGVYNYIAGVYSYFEPPADLRATVWRGERKVAATFTVTGPWGYESTVSSNGSGELKLTGLDLGRYELTDQKGNVYTLDVTEAGCNAVILLK